MIDMFKDAKNFNQDISSWDTSRVVDMGRMFSGASSFNQDISSWDVSRVTDMNSMFNGAKAFNQDLSEWNVNRVSYIKNFNTDSHPDFNNKKIPKKFVYLLNN
nr:BspA family leucine-rich repeat surface protein [Mycoplasma capricolum]